MSTMQIGGGPGGLLGGLGRALLEKSQGSADSAAAVKGGLRKTGAQLSVIDSVLGALGVGGGSAVDDVLDELEEVLIMSDFGPRTSGKLCDALREEIEDGALDATDGVAVKARLKGMIVDTLAAAEGDAALRLGERAAGGGGGEGGPAVVLICGVNGAGKTTTIGKVANMLRGEGASVMLGAGDTFRAAAVEQLEEWAGRTGCSFHRAASKEERPAEVLTGAVRKATEAGDVDVVVCDTSGRLHNNYELMDELEGVRDALAEMREGAPDETLLVLDGTTGLNMLTQAREFNDTVGVSGLVLTKLDGTARGGCVVSVVDDLKIPVKFIGVGERLEDLRPFDAAAYVDALFPDDAAE
eukprot:PRCOL_00006003-RA